MTSTDRTCRPDRTSAATTSGDSATKKPPLRLDPPAELRIRQPDVVGEPGIVRVLDRELRHRGTVQGRSRPPALNQSASVSDIPRGGSRDVGSRFAPRASRMGRVMGLEPKGDTAGGTAVTLETATPVSVEAALRRVRVLTAVLVGARLATSHAFPLWVIGTLVIAFLAVNVISLVSRNESDRIHATLAILQLLADTVVVLLVTFVRRGSPDTADWAVLVLPVIEGAIQFQMLGAILSWSVVAAGYGGWTLGLHHQIGRRDRRPAARDRAARGSPERLPRREPRGRDRRAPAGPLRSRAPGCLAARRRRWAGAGPRRSTSTRSSACCAARSPTWDSRTRWCSSWSAGRRSGSWRDPVRQSRDLVAIPPGDERLSAADHARQTGLPVVWPPEHTSGDDRPFRTDARRAPVASVSKLFAVPVTSGDTGTIVLTARWPGPGTLPASQTESLELFAAQAGASLRNAQVFLELQALKDRLAHEASHDALTDLPNRRRFHEQLERMCNRGRGDGTLAVLFLDLDGFKDVNDRLGHDAGNELLVAVAGRLLRCVRPGDVVARMGGDEFAIMLTRIDNAAPAVEVADRVCALLLDPFGLDGGEIRISTSIGIALAPADTADPGDLVRRADVAMYRAKSQGKAGWAMDPSSIAPAPYPRVEQSPLPSSFEKP